MFNRILSVVFVLLTAAPILSFSQQLRLNTHYPGNDTIVKQQVIYKNPGSSGKDVTWDFGMLQPISEAETHYILSPSDSGRYTCHEHATRTYFILHGNSIFCSGYENAKLKIIYTEQPVSMRFPFCYGDTLGAAFSGTGEYGHRLALSVKGYSHITADATGTLILPDRVIHNVLRTTTYMRYTEIAKKERETELYHYRWYSSACHYPVFESLEWIIHKNENDTAVLQQSWWLPGDQQAGTAENPLKEESTASSRGCIVNALSYSPNPVINDMTVSFSLEEDAVVGIAVHAADGMPVRSMQLGRLAAGIHYITVPMNGCMQAAYTLYVFADGETLQTVVIKQ